MEIRACYLLKDSFDKLSRIAAGITSKHDVEGLKRRISYENKNAICNFNEILSIIEESLSYKFLDSKQIYIEMMDFIMQLEDPIQIQTYINNTLELMPKVDSLEILSLYDLKRYYKLKDGMHSSCANLNEEVMKKIVKHIKSYRKINMLDCRAKTGVNAERFKEYFLGDVDIYGMEANSVLANEAKEKNVYVKMAKGGLNYSKCSNAVFDVVLHAPSFKADTKFTNTQSLTVSEETLDIRKITTYLNYGGVLIYYMHKYRLNASMCTYIAKNYKNVKIIEEPNEPSMITIIAQRKISNDNIDEEVFTKLRNITQDMPCDNDIDIDYVIEGNISEVKIFRGSVLDESDILEIVSETKLMNNFLLKQNQESNPEYNKQQPLLPFSLGQIGLVLTSGCLDGVIEELPGQYHVIKGAVKKESVHEIIKGKTKEEDKEVITHLNKVEIKILTPDGEIKILA